MFMIPSLVLWNIWKATKKCKFDDSVISAVAIVLESIRAEVLQLYIDANKLLPYFIRWIGISPAVENASSLVLLR